jgi:hypothetical protein
VTIPCTRLLDHIGRRQRVALGGTRG